MRAKLEIVYRAPKDLRAYGKNSRTHTPAQVASIQASIREFGFTNPILLMDDGITIGAGHARCRAALAESIDAVPTITLPGLNETQWRAYVIADNQLAISGAGWDDELLSGELAGLMDDGFDMSLLGFSDAELAALMIDKTDGLTDPDDVLRR